MNTKYSTGNSMKIKTLILAGILGTAMASQGAIVYSENFTSIPPFTSSSAAQAFNGSNTDSWMVPDNEYSFGGGEFQLGPRARGGVIWLDTPSWAGGTVTVEFDVTAYTAAASGDIYFQAFSADGVDGSNTVTFDLQAANGVDVQTGTTGSPTFGTIGARNLITATGTDLSYDFTYTGQEHIALLFYTMGGSSNVQLDNITVEAALVPEPSTLALLGAGGAMLMAARRRTARA